MHFKLDIYQLFAMVPALILRPAADSGTICIKAAMVCIIFNLKIYFNGVHVRAPHAIYA